MNENIAYLSLYYLPLMWYISQMICVIKQEKVNEYNDKWHIYICVTKNYYSYRFKKKSQQNFSTFDKIYLKFSLSYYKKDISPLEIIIGQWHISNTFC